VCCPANWPLSCGPILNNPQTFDAHHHHHRLQFRLLSLKILEYFAVSSHQTEPLNRRTTQQSTDDILYLLHLVCMLEIEFENYPVCTVARTSHASAARCGLSVSFPSPSYYLAPRLLSKALCHTSILSTTPISRCGCSSDKGVLAAFQIAVRLETAVLAAQQTKSALAMRQGT
jgi:hypothetical protein